MNSLNASPLSAVLGRLVAESSRADAQLWKQLEGMPQHERDALMAQVRDDPGRFYKTHAKDAFLAVSEATGRLLYLLARSRGAKHVVEFGTSFGVSTLFLAAAVRDNGGGRVIATEFEPAKVKKARATFEEAGVAGLVDLREGDAIETLSRDLPASIDFVLLDGAKPLYSRVLALLEPRLAPGALLVADNVDQCPEYVQQVRQQPDRWLSLPYTDEVELTLFLGR